MKVVILAGGRGTRLAEETELHPKPMVEIGGRPILWHIMKYYANYGFNEFVVALGYKGEVIKRFFLDYPHINSSFTVRLDSGHISQYQPCREDWTVHLIDTGMHTITGGRIKRLGSLIGNETFMMTYGDGLANVNLRELLEFHRAHGKLATVTAVRPPARYGALVFRNDRVVRFSEKPLNGEGWVNGGFFVLEPNVMEYIEGDETHWEREPLDRLAAEGSLMAFHHECFWQSMDTLRDVRLLENLWANGAPPWKVWA